MEEDVLPKVHQNLVHSLGPAFVSEVTPHSPNKNTWPTNIQKRNPPPIPKRNPDTRLSASILTRPGNSGTLGRRSLQSEHPGPLHHSDDATCSATDPATITGIRPTSTTGRPSYAHPVLRQYSTLPGRRNRAQKLDVCAELLSYISELTQELMAETSFTEPAFDDAGSTTGDTSGTTPANGWPNTHRAPPKSVAIQTEDPEMTDSPDPPAAHRPPDDGRRSSSGTSIGIQVTNRPSGKPSGHRRGEKPSAAVPPQPEVTPSPDPPDIPPLPVMIRTPEVVAVDSPSSVSSPTKPFNVIRKMLREGSIEGIEDEPPVFKPPPPPALTQVAYVTGRPHHPSPDEPTADQPEPHSPWPPGSPATNSKVKKCLSTFEPPEMAIESLRNGTTSAGATTSSKKPSGHAKGVLGHHRHNKKGSSAQKSAKLITSQTSTAKSIPPSIQPSISIVQRKATLAEHMSPVGQQQQPDVFVNGGGSGKRKISVLSARSPSFTSKAATLDRCFHQKMTSPVDGRLQLQQGGQNVTRTPPPPPLGKEPPPKILVEMPTKKHRQSSSACGTSCSCLCLKRQSPCSSPVLSLGSIPSSPPPAAPKRYSGYSPSAKDKSPDISQFTTDVSSVRQDAYDALIAEIRAAIKQRQASPGHDEQAL